MIFEGSRIEIRPNKRYRDNPELNEDIEVGEGRFGSYQQCQIIDRNATEDGKVKTGFFYCRIHTNLNLKVGDIVTVDKILYVQRKQNICVIAINIKESSPTTSIEDVIEEQYEF